MKKVTTEEAMEQILKYSPVVRDNPYKKADKMDNESHWEDGTELSFELEGKVFMVLKKPDGTVVSKEEFGSELVLQLLVKEISEMLKEQDEFLPKNKIKVNKNHVWIVEILVENEWVPYNSMQYDTRDNARKAALRYQNERAYLYSTYSDKKIDSVKNKFRVRKIIYSHNDR